MVVNLSWRVFLSLEGGYGEGCSLAAGFCSFVFMENTFQRLPVPSPAHSDLTWFDIKHKKTGQRLWSYEYWFFSFDDDWEILYILRPKV